jgi:hypothetical protein
LDYGAVLVLPDTNISVDLAASTFNVKTSTLMSGTSMGRLQFIFSLRMEAALFSKTIISYTVSQPRRRPQLESSPL